MRVVRFPYELPDGVTQSLLSSFLSCRKRCELILQGWQPLEKSKLFSYGELFHAVLEYYYKELRGKRQIGEDFLPRAIGTWYQKVTEPGAQFDIEHIEETCYTVAALWPEYQQRWQKQDLEWAWLDCERIFDVQFSGLRLRGKIDGLVRIGKSLWILETKTKSEISEDVLGMTLPFDFQNLFYITALKAEGVECIGAIYNIIRNPRLRRGKTETKDQFLERVIQDVRERPEHYFHRFEVPYDKETIKEFGKELAFKLAEFRDWVNDILPTYKNQGSCVGRGYCPFLEACSSGKMYAYEQTRVLFEELRESPPLAEEEKKC
jgi:hypothetical protein